MRRAAGKPIAAEVLTAFEAALNRLADLGAEMVAMKGDDFDIEPIWRVINHTTWRARFAEMVAREGNRMSPSLIRQVELASEVSGIEYQQAMFARASLFRRVQGMLRDADLLAMPTLSRTALPIEQDLFQPVEIDGQSYADVRANWFPGPCPST